MERLERIADASILAGLSPEQRASVAAIARELKFSRGEYLFRIGEAASTLFVIRQGTIELTHPLEILNQSREVVITELGAGETLAWSALVSPYVLTMSARATTDADLVGFKRDELESLFEANPDIGYRMMSRLAGIVGRRLDVTHVLWTRELQRSVGEKYK